MTDPKANATLLATVKKVLPNELFLVTVVQAGSLAGDVPAGGVSVGRELTVHASGKMRNRFVRLQVGDEVRVNPSPFDATKGRIVHEQPGPAQVSGNTP